jgi:hypothetical protein
MIFLGAEVKDRNKKDDATGAWHKTGQKIKLVRLLDNEGGIIEIMQREESDFSLTEGFKQLQPVDVELKITVGKYINIDIVSMLPELEVNADELAPPLPVKKVK